MGVVVGGERARTDPDELKVLQEYQQSVAGARGGGPPRSDVVLVTLPMHQGAGPGSVWGATARGGAMVFQRRFDPEDALRLIETHKVTAWTGVPTMYKRLAALPPEIAARYDVSSVPSVGAAPVPYSPKEWIIGHFGPVLSEG